MVFSCPAPQFNVQIPQTTTELSLLPVSWYENVTYKVYFLPDHLTLNRPSEELSHSTIHSHFILNVTDICQNLMIKSDELSHYILLYYKIANEVVAMTVFTLLNHRVCSCIFNEMLYYFCNPYFMLIRSRK